MNSQRVILAGGTGFLGNLLARRFTKRGDEVIVLTRSPRSRTDGVREILWDGQTLGEWAKVIDGAQTLVNLSGRSVNCRYHARHQEEILNSRVRSTRVLGEAMMRCVRPPSVWLNCSTATIYRHSLDRPMDEAGAIEATTEAKDAFSVDVALAWEHALEEAPVTSTRKVALRLAMVFGRGRNSVFPVLRRLARSGLGGKMGSGKQFVSWIHEEDFCRVIEWLISRNDMTGAVNVAAPNPVSNQEMMRIVRQVCGIPLGLPAPLWMLEAGAWFLRTETELIIKSRRVVPGRLLAAGFEFTFSRLEDAVVEIEKRFNDGD
jgi:uncharacterized protein